MSDKPIDVEVDDSVVGSLDQVLLTVHPSEGALTVVMQRRHGAGRIGVVFTQSKTVEHVIALLTSASKKAGLR